MIVNLVLSIRRLQMQFERILQKSFLQFMSVLLFEQNSDNLSAQTALWQTLPNLGSGQKRFGKKVIR